MKRIIHYENSFSKSSNTNHVFTIYIKTLYTDSQRGKFWFETNLDILISDLCLDEVINEDAMVFGSIGFVVMTSPSPRRLQAKIYLSHSIYFHVLDGVLRIEGPTHIHFSRQEAGFFFKVHSTLTASGPPLFSSSIKEFALVS